MGTPYFNFANRPAPAMNFFQPPEIDWNQPAPDADEELLKQIYNQDSTPAVQKYLDYLSKVPQRDESNKPSFWRRLLAGASGMSSGWFNGPEAGINVARNVNDYPYQMAMEQYQSQLPKYKEAVDLENQDQNQKLALYKAITENRWKKDDSQRGWYNADTQRMGENRQSRTPQFFDVNGRRNMWTLSGGLQDVGESEGSMNRRQTSDLQRQRESFDERMRRLGFSFDQSLESQRQNDRERQWNFERNNPKPEIRPGNGAFVNITPPSANSPGSSVAIPGVGPQVRGQGTSLMDRNRAEDLAVTAVMRDYPKEFRKNMDGFSNGKPVWKQEADPVFTRMVTDYVTWIRDGEKGPKPSYNNTKKKMMDEGWKR